MRNPWPAILLFIFSLGTTQAQKTFLKKTYFDPEKKRLKETITLKTADSTLHGVYHSFYENGSLAINGFYENNQSDSVWIYYYENGRIKATGPYQNGRQNRKWRYYFENGQLKAEGIYRMDIRHGAWAYYYEQGAEKSAGIYFNDEKEGLWNYFYEDGSLKAQAYYEHGSGPYKEFYSSGKLKTEGHNENEKSEGQWIYYYETGEVEAKGNFKNGLRDGFWQYWHTNGQVAAEGVFIEGEKSGTWKYYFPDGSVSSQGEMVSDERDGFWKLYYQSGEVKGEGRFDQGSGEYIEYYASGKQKARGALKNGRKEGKWIYFSEEGLEDGIAVFDNGIGEYKGYYPDGTLKMDGRIEDNKRVGQWTLYNPDGSVAGIYKPVYEDDKPIFRTSDALKDESAKKSADKPEYKYKNRKLRYFNPRINEYTGFIVATNPLWLFMNKIPVSVEYYIQERLGYEVQIMLLKDPFFKNSGDVVTNRIYSLGTEVSIRQKFYHTDQKFGMLYFGHQLAAGYYEHGSHVIDSLNFSNFPVEKNISSTESTFSYGLLVGNRWTERTGDSGVTIDFHVGLGLGYRNVREEFDPHPDFTSLFNELNSDGFYLPIIFTLNIGYAGPKRRSISF